MFLKNLNFFRQGFKIQFYKNSYSVILLNIKSATNLLPYGVI